MPTKWEFNKESNENCFSLFSSQVVLCRSCLWRRIPPYFDDVPWIRKGYAFLVKLRRTNGIYSLCSCLDMAVTIFFNKSIKVTFGNALSVHDDFSAPFPVQYGSFAILEVVPKSHGFSVSVFRNGVRQCFSKYVGIRFFFFCGLYVSIRYYRCSLLCILGGLDLFP